ENLFPGDRHVVLHIDEYGRFHEVTGEAFRVTLASEQQLRALFEALADVRLHAVVLLLRRHRPDSGFWIGRIACRKRANRLLDSPLDLVQPALWREHPRPGDTGLSAVQERDRERRRDSLGEIGVVEQ